MDLDEFDFGLPEAPGSQLSEFLNEPEAISPYSDVGMMDDVNAESFNPFSQLEDTFSSAPASIASSPVSNASSHNLSEFGFELPNSAGEQAAPAFVVSKGGLAFHKHMIHGSIIAMIVLLIFSIIVLGMYALALSKLIDIDYAVNHLVLNIDRLW